MATENSKPKTAAEAATHLAKVQEELIRLYAGKSGYNPYFFISNTVLPAIAKIAGSDAKQADIDAALAITSDEKNAKIVVAPTASEPIKGIDNTFNNDKPKAVDPTKK